MATRRVLIDMYVYGSAPWHWGSLYMTERLVMAEIPSEQTTQGQGRQGRQQEVGDSVEMQWAEGRHGDGQREREAGGQSEEFAGRRETWVSMAEDVC